MAIEFFVHLLIQFDHLINFDKIKLLYDQIRDTFLHKIGKSQYCFFEDYRSILLSSKANCNKR